MSYVERSDGELLAFAREGVASAFAVLLYRHGPEVLGMAQRDPDPVGAVVATYIRAMRALPNADPDDVRLWLLGFAAEEIEGDVDIPAALAVGSAASSATAGHTAAATSSAVSQASNETARTVPFGRGPLDTPPMETDDDLDEAWAELALRWPTGRAPRHLPAWAIWVITTLVLIALAILLPWAVLGASGDDAETIEELRASPVLEDLTFQEEEPEDDDVEEQELPTFDFPAPPEGDPEPEPTEDTEPPPAPDPEPEADDPDAVGGSDDTTGDATDDEGEADSGVEGDPDDGTDGDGGDGDGGDDTVDEGGDGVDDTVDEGGDGAAASDDGADDGGDA